MYIDINCDLGETDPAARPGNDEVLMPFITSAGMDPALQLYVDKKTVCKTLVKQSGPESGKKYSLDSTGFAARKMIGL